MSQGSSTWLNYVSAALVIAVICIHFGLGDRVATIIVGTEINLVERLAVEQAGKKRVRPLQRSFCPNMYKINLKNLSETLSRLDDDRFVVTVKPDIVRDARIALQRMLEIA